MDRESNTSPCDSLFNEGVTVGRLAIADLEGWLSGFVKVEDGAQSVTIAKHLFQWSDDRMDSLILAKLMIIFRLSL